MRYFRASTAVVRIGAILGGAATAMLLAATVPAPATAATLPPDPVHARLVPETGSIVPGSTLWVDLHLDIAKGWHTYWRNPGDSGLPTEIAWHLPPGFKAGEMAWPAPERFVLGTIGNYGYSGSADLLVPITAPADAQPGSTAHLAADATWLVCSDICIPGEAHLALDLPVGPAVAASAPAVAALFAAARHRVPQPAGFTPRFAASERELRLTIPAEALADIDRLTAEFFPVTGNLIDAAAEPKQQRRDGGIELSLQRLTGGAAGNPPPTLDGVLVLRGADGNERAYAIAATRMTMPAVDAEAGIGWWQALLLALLGGIALNLMPCVFPILSLKVLGLTMSVHRAEERRQGLAYAAEHPERLQRLVLFNTYARVEDAFSREVLTALEVMRSVIDHVDPNKRRAIDLTGLGNAFGAE